MLHLIYLIKIILEEINYQKKEALMKILEEGIEKIQFIGSVYFK